MERDYRFDIARLICMTYIVAFLHLYAYIHTEAKSACVIPACAILCDACLGLFTFTSGYLIGKKYQFGKTGTPILQFYRRRIVRVVPLFVIASVALYAIGFNGGRQALNGLLCISPFIRPRPLTLWYIPVLLLLYLVTPLLSREKIQHRIAASFFFLMALGVLYNVIPSVDHRLLYNAFFYCFGVCSAPLWDWKLSGLKGLVFKIGWVLLFCFLLFAGQYIPFFSVTAYRRIFAAIGVMAILIVCESLDLLIFRYKAKINRGGEFVVCQCVVRCVSYASMAVYMFHRVFFWLGELIWNPEVGWVKWCYMGLVVFPLMCIVSYYIQKRYDAIVNRFKI